MKPWGKSSDTNKKGKWGGEPLGSWSRLTTPSTLELPLRTATAFLVSATTATGFGAATAVRFKDDGDRRRGWEGRDE
ncbi:hypothetical protein DsansV1_C10g0098881 [Dioscorea sansibarensis]